MSPWPPSWMSTVSWAQRFSWGQFCQGLGLWRPILSQEGCFCQGRERGRKRRLGEHISEAQKPSDIAPDHTAFEHRGVESETHGTRSLQVTHGLRNQGKPKSTLRPRRQLEPVPAAVLGKQGRLGRWMFSLDLTHQTNENWGPRI